MYASTGDGKYAAHAAGYAQPGRDAVRNMSKGAVLAEIAKEQQARLFSEALPAAVGCLIDIITNPKAPAGARVQASKVVMDRTLGVEGAGSTKEAHEMTAEELAKAIEEMERVAAGRAKRIDAIEVAEIAQDDDIFG